MLGLVRKPWNKDPIMNQSVFYGKYPAVFFPWPSYMVTPWWSGDPFRKELYADPTKHFTDEELKERDANIKPGEEVADSKKSPTVGPTKERTPKTPWVSNSSIANYWTGSIGKVPFCFWWTEGFFFTCFFWFPEVFPRGNVSFYFGENPIIRAV